MNEMTRISAQPAYSEAAQKALARLPQLFINGDWVDSTGGETLAVIDPSNGREVSRFVDATNEDVDRAVAAARTAFDDGRWTGLPPIAREGLINRLADLLEANTDEFAELEAIDNGKPKGIAAAVDIPASIRMLRYTAGWTTKLGGDMIDPMGAPAGAFHAYVRREPVGVAAQIVPWNFPMIMATQKIAPALAAGCTVVLKPAEQTSVTALRLADLVAEAGFPAGVINVITGLGETAGDRLVRHPDVDKVAFTGSTEVGKIINRAATDSLKRVTLELGGKSPVIVLPDVDVDATAGGAAGAIFFNSGQICVAGSRLFAHRSIFDRLLEGVAGHAQHWAPGPSLHPGTRMGPLVSDEQQRRVMDYIDQGRKAGASILTGGDAVGSEGYYVNPTVIVDVHPEMSVVREEIFGPVLVAQRFDDLDEVAKAANDTVYGLGASIWTRDLANMHRLAAKIKAGTVWGNCHSVIDPALPFGGYKQSGLGREQARQGVEAYTELKTVVIAL
jgi:phenylacetaldehyde dehydrogenase